MVEKEFVAAAASDGRSAVPSKDEDDARLIREREYHNERFTEDVRSAQWKYYWAVETGIQRYINNVKTYSEGANFLELGSGLGQNLLGGETKFASATGIDISDVGVRKAAEMAVARGLNNVRFVCGDAQATGLPSSSFDLIYGSGIVHHLDIGRCARETHRLLRPGGRAIYWEPLGHNPIINLYRKLTPKSRTHDEQPLRRAHFRELANVFPKMKVEYFGLVSLAVVPLRRSAIVKPARAVADVVDKLLLSLPILRWGAWFSLITLPKG